jgi:hypothetical protein
LQELVNVESEKPCVFPIEDLYGHQLAFHSLELALSTIDIQSLRNSEVFAVTRNAIIETSEIVRESGATFILAFIPHKAHVYWDALVQADRINTISQSTAIFIPTHEGLIIDQARRSTEHIASSLLENIDAQRELLSELAEEEGFLFLDFTPRFQAASAMSDPLYFFGDTHWNQNGHDLAHTILTDFLLEHNLIDIEVRQQSQ